MDTLNDKIVTIIDALGYSNTKFADAISVSRPTISHILSGRNKPSIDIIQKILVKYPELGYKWFLDEESLDPEKLTLLTSNHGEQTLIEPTIINNGESAKPHPKRQEINVNASREFQYDNGGGDTITPRRVERVIMFYTDGSIEVLSGTPQVV